VYRSDLFSSLPTALRGTIGVLVANAPYVPTAALRTMPREARLHEPPATLDGGPDGMDIHRRLAASAASWLTPGGSILVESSDRQAPSIARLFDRHGYRVRTDSSDDGDTCVVLGTLPG
jgi:release factor glutamine methyltransferase